MGDVFDQLSAQLKAVALPEQREQVDQFSRRFRSIHKLTTGMPHEVKNPLNAMTIHLELLKQKLARKDPAGAATHADVIGREIKRLDEVVQNFLAFVRPTEVSFVPVPLTTLLESVLDEVRQEAAQAKVTVHSSDADSGLQVEGDSTLLRQAFLNLAQNAIHAMPNGGRLSLTCKALSDGRVSIRVEDTGKGIPPQDLERIFELYFTTKPNGSGIGLSFVLRTIELLHNGTIKVESTLGKGTTFIVTLPLGPTGANASPGSRSLTSEAAAGLQLR